MARALPASLFAVAVAVAAALGASACERPRSAAPPGIACDSGRGSMSERGGFRRFAVAEDASGAAFVSVGDLNGDGRPDLVVSRFGSYSVDGGSVTLSPATLEVYYQGGALSCWQHTQIVGPEAGWYFINDVTPADIDGDGDVDLVVPSGFFVCGFDPAVRSCGALAWLEKRNGAWKRHDLVGPANPRFFHHVEWVDFDGDGRKDLVTVGEESSGPETYWLAGSDDGDRFEKTPRPLGAALGSFPQVVDVDGDGDLDVAAAEYFVPGTSFAWLERTAAGGFAPHVIDASSGRGFALRLVDDLYGDGVTRAIASNHTNVADDNHAVASALFVFDRPADATTAWPGHPISDGIAARPSIGNAVQNAPGVFGAGDIDGDGDIDIALSGDGDARTFWLEQTAPGQFATHVIEPQLGQASGARVVDLDGDGHDELVFTGYEAGAVYVYEWPR